MNDPAKRYLLNPETGILVIIDENGKATFHNKDGFPTSDPVNISTQEAAVRIFQQHGYKEVPPV